MIKSKAVFILCLLFVVGSYAKYDPTWDSLDSRPLPSWYDEAKFGIFIHWGVYSVPSFGSEWFWNQWENGSDSYVNYMKKNYPEGFTYQDFAGSFTAEFFNADDWAKIIAASGAKYMVITTKHHEGYTLWPSKYSYSWNAKDVGPSRDLIGELSEAVRKQNITFGAYHSLYEWFNPLYLADVAANFTTQDFVNNKIYPELQELVVKYKPSVIWSDGGKGTVDYWKSKEFLAWLYNDSPVKDVVVTNDRWGDGTGCKHGDFFNCRDRYNPGTLQPHKWENAMTIDKKSWGYRRNARLSEYYNIEGLLESLASTVSCGGNLLLNIGPTKDGVIAPIFEERLEQIGTWLSINGEAIYGTKSWSAQNDTITPTTWYTSKNNIIYAIALKWPAGNVLSLGSSLDVFKHDKTVVTLLGNENGALKWELQETDVKIQFPDKAEVKSEWSYVLKIVPGA